MNTPDSKDDNKNQIEELSRHLTRTEKLATIGKLSRGIVHEMKNQLGCVALFDELLRDPSLSEAAKSYIQLTARAMQRLQFLVDLIVKYGHENSWPLSSIPTDFNRLIHNCIEFCRFDRRLKRKRVEESLTEPIPMALCDPETLQQVVVNMLRNAAAIMKSDGTIHVSSFHEGLMNTLLIRGKGLKITNAELDPLWKPIFVLEDDDWIGLGLSLCERIIVEMGGRFSVLISQEDEILVTISIPIVQAAEDKQYA